MPSEPAVEPPSPAVEPATLAADEPVYDTADGKAPWIKVSLPPDHVGPYLDVVPFTIESNSSFSGSSDIWIENDLWFDGTKFQPSGALKQTFDIEPFYEGRTWINWDLRTASGGRYAGST